MKKVILFFCMIFVFAIVNGQVVTKDNVSTINTHKVYLPSPNAGKQNVEVYRNSNYINPQQIMTATCIDTIYYPQSKLTAPDPFALMESTGGVTGVSQTFNANTGLIHGIRAFVTVDTNGIPGDTPPLVMKISVVNVDGINRPTTVIASDLVVVNDVGNVEQNLMFTAPVAVSGKYAVVVELDPLSPTIDTAYYLANNQGLFDGAGEGLMGVYFAGTWYNFLFQFGVYDADALLAPIFEKTITSAYTTDKDSICAGDSIVFTNTSVFDTNSMYNLYNSTTQPLYQWDYDDGTGIYNHLDTTYTYSTGGTYNTQLLITNYGYTANCVDSSQHTIEVFQPNVVASSDTAVCAGDTVFLIATGATNYTWDNGLGAGQNHNIVPAIDTAYVVTGTAGPGCTDIDTVNVTVNALPNVQASQDTIVCVTASANISATGATTYAWDNGLGAGQNQTVTPLIDTAYVVTGTDGVGCSNTDTVFVAVAPCNCVDTVYYPQSKLTAPDPFALMDISGVTGVAETFNANTGLIHGIRAFVTIDTNNIIGDANPINIQISVMNVDAQNIPTTVIASNLVTLNDIGNSYQNLFFTQPVAVSGKYAVVVELDPASATTDTAYYLANNQGLFDGAGEGLMAIDFSGSSFNFFTQFAVYDADFLVAPIFDKVITSSYTTDKDSICAGDSILFTNTSTFDTTSMYNLYNSTTNPLYQWDYDDGTGIYNHLDTTYTFNSGGSDTTQLLITNYGYTGNCVDSSQHIIEVFQPVIIASVDTAVCSGDTVFLSATGGTTYTWDNGLGAGQNQTPIPTIDTMYVVTGTAGPGCTGTDTVNVTINALPIVIASNDTTLCAGDTVFLSATGGTIYNWDNGLGAGQNQQANPIIDTMYVVTGTDGVGCSNMDTVNVTINALPTVTASNDTTVCSGDTATISANSTITTYTWDNGLGVGQSHQVAPTVLTAYIVTVTDANSCSGTDTVNVSVNALPILTTSNDTSICQGDSLTISVSGATAYTWDNGLGAGATQLLITPLDTAYMVIGIDGNGCSNTDSVVVTLNSMPTIVASNDTTICVGSSATISATGATILTWDNGLGTGQSFVVNPSVATTYIVVGDENGCLGTDTVNVSIDNSSCFTIPNVFTPNGDGTNDLWNISGIELYPEMVVKVFNRWGDIMFQSAAGYPESWDGSYNGTQSPSATYYYIITLGDGGEGLTGTINIVR